MKRESTKEKAVVIAAFVLLIIILAFIWGNSMLSRETSAGESNAVLQFIYPFLHKFFDGVLAQNDHFLRKAAHFLEFGALGAVSSVLFFYRRGFSGWKLSECMTFIFSVALIDETIQMFSDRGSQFSDVCLDFVGGCVGMVITALLIIRIRRRKYEDYSKDQDRSA